MGVPMSIRHDGTLSATRTKRWRSGFPQLMFDVRAITHRMTPEEQLQVLFEVQGSNLLLLTETTYVGNVVLHLIDAAKLTQVRTAAFHGGDDAVTNIRQNNKSALVKSFARVDDVWGEYPLQ